jgi:diaminopimelate decarboxylase
MPDLEAGRGIDFRAIAEEHMEEGGLFVYDRDMLARTAQDLLDIGQPDGLTVRYAAKANPHPEIVSLFDDMGLHFDASSVYEAARLLRYGVDGEKISLSSQILRLDATLQHEVLSQGVLPVATSLRQIRVLGNLGCQEIAVRVNPGVGHGHNNRTNVGGPSSSFGIWHEELPAVLDVARRGGQAINRLHTHIGSGAESDVWRGVIQKSLDIAERLPDVTTLDIGGGYKIARMPGETSTDMNEVCGVFAEELEQFADRTGRDIGLEIEPGTALVANAGTLLGRIEEVVETDKYRFLKLNVGMNAILRPSLYGAQHPIEVLNDAAEQEEYVVVGPCCESGDILTPAQGDPEGIRPRILNKAEVDDFVAIGGAGAYCASMSANRYNDMPEATEIVV